MKTFLDCFSCFLKQALEAARFAGAGIDTQRQVLNEIARALPELPLQASPPEMSRTIQGLIKAKTGVDDPYLRIKEHSNRMALDIYPHLVQKLDGSRDRLLTAVELAIAGNIIDYGAKNNLNVDAELEKILATKDTINIKKNGAYFQFVQFQSALITAKTILYLADNAGEIVFDRLLLEEIRRLDPTKKIIFAVKEKPAINDALQKDAQDCGIDRLAEILSSGSDAPGIILSLCSDQFLDDFDKADMVISKGQGNFEGLSGADRSIFFLFIAKCPVIATDVGCNVGDFILIQHK
jgi:uncharacterized protein with ATP-grasp and redox domains